MAEAARRHEPVVDHLAEVWSSLAVACQGLGPAQWDLATACPGWTVRDQLSHLVGVERMVLGDEAPPPLEDLPDHVRNPFAELNEPWVHQRRGVPGPEVLDEFMAVTARRLDELRALPAGRFDQVGWSPVGEVTYREFLTTRVQDSWAHEQDVRQSLGRPGGRNGAGEQAVLDRCADTMPYVVGKRVAPPEWTTVLFVVTGVLGRRIPVTMFDGRAVSGPDPGTATATATLTSDQDTFWRLGFGRLDPERALGSGLVRIDGDVALGHRVLGAMTFMV